MHVTRFIYPLFFKKNKARISFNNKASKQLIEEAVTAQKTAKSIHDELENCYRDKIDFMSIEAVIKEFIEYIFKNN